MNFADKLQFLRKSRNLTQEQLAELIDVSPVTVRFWETDKVIPTAVNVFALAEALNVEAKQIWKG